MLISELLGFIEGFAPLSLALDWDNVGLLAGDPQGSFTRALITLDVTPNAVAKALKTGCDLILSHHPLIFKPINRINDPLLLKILENRISVICLHTNLDVAPQGVNHALAEALGLEITSRLTSEQGGKWYRLSVFVPADHSGKLSEAVFQAGGGRIGNYVSCSTRRQVSGTFQPLPGARPFLENPDSAGLTTVDEVELEFMVDEAKLRSVLASIRAVHPYEMPLLYYFPVAEGNPAYGLGLVGKFPSPLSLEDICKLVSQKLGCPHPRLWTAGLALETKIERIAVCGGAGGSVLKNAARVADLVITGDVNYHALLESSLPIIDAGHFYTEYPVLEYLKCQLASLGAECVVLPREEHEFRQNYLDSGY